AEDGIRGRNVTGVQTCALPISFFAVLYHLGVMQLIIRAAAWLMTRVIGASGAESLNVAATIVTDQTEGPLTIRPFLPKLTKSERSEERRVGKVSRSRSLLYHYS